MLPLTWPSGSASGTSRSVAEHSFVIEIAAPPETVYDTWIDPNRMPEWTEGLSRVTDVIGLPGQTGTRYTVWFGRTSAAAEVMIGERPTRFDWRVRMGPLAAEFQSSFHASGDGTRMSETVRTRGLLAWLWNRILSTGRYRGSFRGELETFRRICERETVGTRVDVPSE